MTFSILFLLILKGPLSLHRNSQSPIDPRGGGHQHKRLRRMSSTEDDMQDVSSQGGGGSGGGGGGGATSSSSIIIRSGGGQQQQSDNNKSIPSAADLSYYGHQQSPNSLSNQTSWHSEMDHGELHNRPIILFPSFF